MRRPLILLGVTLLLPELGRRLVTGENPFVEPGDRIGSGPAQVCD